MTSLVVRAGDVELAVETFGDPADPTILLIHGASASMLWWEAALCARIAAAGRHVVRCDQRDTGLSTTFPLGDPGYAMSDLARDAVAILDALGVERAHVVGRSMSGGVALMLAVDHASRVATVTFVSTTTGDDDLPPPTDAFRAASPQGEMDPADPEGAVDLLVASIRAYVGDDPGFDEQATRTLAAADVARTRDLRAATTNHFAMTFDAPVGGGFAEVRMPALVVHGERDPVFPLAHGRALQAAMPGSTLVVLPGSGHEVLERSWPAFVDALVAHTAR
ncbi:alpha/beta fold hydrolase [Agrococcus jejuensis]|uniref:Pimeloyl-ACP methyl ester carboxylesterase n=1 Tax=Agrococcus jejuensis TaxID=399736 RepID=A0A1G8D8N1_9MICO|nr:alpha/beta hydrolase [Agrococcus jejuensis]SDH53894.1 Pimeloyl-ACP methyl ester carboxylesterase [Agrococcus jejuensis]